MCVGKNGYGFCKGSTAHKRSYEDHVGPVPTGFVLRHTCENKRCCNPEHLIIGTQRDNYYDMSEEKRKEMHKKAGETYSKRVASGEITYSDEQIEQRRRAGALSRPSLVGRKKSEEHKKALSESLKRYYDSQNDEN